MGPIGGLNRDPTPEIDEVVAFRLFSTALLCVAWGPTKVLWCANHLEVAEITDDPSFLSKHPLKMPEKLWDPEKVQFCCRGV